MRARATQAIHRGRTTGLQQNDCPAFETVYREHNEFVRRRLRSFGIAPADLEDVCHEVFLVVYRQLVTPGEELDHIRNWLHEVCRRKAAGYRRRRFRRAEALVANTAMFLELASSESEDADEEQRRIRTALERLPPNKRELLLLVALADVSISDLALLTQCDRKTARKRLALARERMGRLLNGESLPGATVPEETDVQDLALFDPERVQHDTAAEDSQLRVSVITPFFAAASWRRVFLTVWRRASLIEMEALAATASAVYHAFGGKFAYLTLVEKDCPAPEFASRQRVLEIVKSARPYLSSYATVLSGGSSRFAVSIMNVIFFLAGVEFPVRFFGRLGEAADWTIESLREPTSDAAELAEALAYLRALLGAQA